tara:strand:+ start:5819 stop:6655 length:837 start_codon:yes stop_codon:yes gene_type:complete
MGRWILLFIFVFAGCNILEFTADETSEDSLIYKMQAYINDFNFDAAIAVFTSEMGSSQQSTREAREYYAQAYMGKCGLDFLEFVNDVSDYSGNFFASLLESMENATAPIVNDCAVSESIIDENIANLSPTTTDYNMAVLNAMTKMGNIMNLRGADGNNQVDAGFDTCDTADISDADMQEFVAALSRMLSYIGSSSLNFFNDGDGSNDVDLSGVCDTGQPLEVAGLCDVIDAADVTATQICAARALMRESTDGIGLGLCANDVAGSVCGGGCGGAVCPL